jgi:transcriptional regulator with XRE-family HTH domain
MEKDFDKKLGYVLKKTRKAKKICQPQIAEKLNVTKMAVSYWENGRNSISAEQLKQYCDAIGVSVQEVFDRMEM